MTSATSHSDSPGRRLGFSLTEILVVIGIIVVLVGILVPTIIRAYNQASVTRGKYDLQIIATGLEAYKTDFGDYPRTDPTDASTVKGAHVLCQALFAPGPVASDGAAGLGFRLRPGGTGKVYGPYLQADRFILDDDNLASTAVNYAVVVINTKDYTPILYYPRNPKKPDPTTVNGYMGNSALVSNYYYLDNSKWLTLNPASLLLGDFSCSGNIDSTYGTESAIDMLPYLLISAGPDGGLGPVTAPIAPVTTATQWRQNKGYAASCDDITNFPR